jgi:hypothetical protein
MLTFSPPALVHPKSWLGRLAELVTDCHLKRVSFPRGEDGTAYIETDIAGTHPVVIPRDGGRA